MKKIFFYKGTRILKKFKTLSAILNANGQWSSMASKIRQKMSGYRILGAKYQIKCEEKQSISPGSVRNMTKWYCVYHMPCIRANTCKRQETESGQANLTPDKGKREGRKGRWECLRLQCKFVRVQRPFRKSSSSSGVPDLPVHLRLEAASEKIHHELADGFQRQHQQL